jgi:hypothetical protein
MVCLDYGRGRDHFSFDRLRQPDGLGNSKIHGFASLPHNRFAFIGAILSYKDQAAIGGQTQLNKT